MSTGTATVTMDELAKSASFGEYLADLLMEICRLDTSISADVAALRKAEHAVFDVLGRHVAQYGLAGLRMERKPISPEIQKHEFFSQLYYTKTAENPAGLSVGQTYDGRANLVLMIDGVSGSKDGVAVNGHVDVVRPYIPPRLEGERLFGRGACDDKGAVVALMGALKLVGEYLRATGRKLNKSFTGMVVIEEEMGGNGSLSLAIDRTLRERYDSLMVLECCGNQIHPGNRGALWYKIEASPRGDWMNPFEVAAFIVEELENEGRAIKAESRHDLFPHRPVQTCHGILNHCGEHPSRINGRIDFDIRFDGGKSAQAKPLVQDIIDSAIAQYVGLYGDKTKALDAAGKPKVDHHYDLLNTPDGFPVHVHGSTGHMGSILENDGAITKMATIVRSLICSRARIEKTAGAKMTLALHDDKTPRHLLMEGGQGFLPTHAMPEIMQRLRQAAYRGVETYARLAGQPTYRAADEFRVSYDKLHNAAFAGRVDSPSMKAALAAAERVGLPQKQPVRGWDVSCDSRIFACEYPDMAALTAGPGALAVAHSDQEQVNMPEVARFAHFLAYFILQQTNSLGD